MPQQKTLSSWLTPSPRNINRDIVSNKRPSPSPVATDISPVSSTMTAADRPNVAKRRKVDEGADSSIDHANLNYINVIEIQGDLFDRPANALLIHACNTQGSWGAGIAKAFHQRYSQAFDVYALHCREAKAKQRNLVGTALLIAPVGWGSSTTSKATTSKITSTEASRAKQSIATQRAHFVGCLFTSRAFGKRKDSPEQILEATEVAMRDLLRQVKAWNEAHRSATMKCDSSEPEHVPDDGEKPSEGFESNESDEAPSHAIKSIHMCKINSGLFAVPWADTRAVLESIDLDEILSADGEHGDDNEKSEHTRLQTIEVVSPS